MGFQVCTGAIISCSFGMEPSLLDVLPDHGVFCPLPAANIEDSIPFINIEPFGMCFSELNPEVILATAAALGVLTPMPCVPIVLDPWFPGALTTMLEGLPALDDLSICFCAWGGLITIDDPGQFDIFVD